MNLGTCEDLWIDIKQGADKKSGEKGSNFVVGVVYRHPTQNYTKFCDKLCKTLNILNKNKTDYMIVGDFNVDILKYSLATNITKYVNSLNSVGCKLFIDKATRVTKTSATCIDHVYSNQPADNIESSILLTDASDHFSTITELRGFHSN